MLEIINFDIRYVEDNSLLCDRTEIIEDNHFLH